MKILKTAAVLVPALAGLGACVDARSLNPQFGQAYGQHVVSQIADPEARYVGDPDPGSNAARVGLAQERYRTGTVIQPVPATASDVGLARSGAQSGQPQ